MNETNHKVSAHSKRPNGSLTFSEMEFTETPVCGRSSHWLINIPATIQPWRKKNSSTFSSKKRFLTEMERVYCVTLIVIIFYAVCWSSSVIILPVCTEEKTPLIYITTWPKYLNGKAHLSACLREKTWDAHKPFEKGLGVDFLFP